jgi:hypothetical protein
VWLPGWLKETAWLIGLVALLVAAMILAFIVLPPLLVSPADLREKIPSTPGLQTATQPTGVDLVQARNGVRTAAVALVAGIGAALATGFAARTYYLTRRGQRNERYKTAVEQLDSQASAVQVSAIGDLERLADEAPSRHRQVMEVLATFLRSYTREDDADQAPAPVQMAFAVLARRKRRYDRGLVLDLAGADLRQVNFDRASLRRAVLRDARLDGAFMRHSDLREANLADAVALSVRLDHAKLRKAVFDGARLEGATLDYADARRATFKDAQLAHTFLRGADLRKTAGLRLQDGVVVGGVTDKDTRRPGA